MQTHERTRIKSRLWRKTKRKRP